VYDTQSDVSESPRPTRWLGLPPYALKGRANRKQPNSAVTGGYLKRTPERLREPAPQVEAKLLTLARAGGRQMERTEVRDAGTSGGVIPRRLGLNSC
jgi:hypothetical protein